MENGAARLRRCAILPSLSSVLVFALIHCPASASLPDGDAPPALEFPHFPGRQYAFVWRNWGLFEPARLAAVLGTSQRNVTDLAGSMGLPPPGYMSSLWLTRWYITLIRRYWHVLFS